MVIESFRNRVERNSKWKEIKVKGSYRSVNRNWALY